MIPLLIATGEILLESTISVGVSWAVGAVNDWIFGTPSPPSRVMGNQIARMRNKLLDGSLATFGSNDIVAVYRASLQRFELATFLFDMAEMAYKNRSTDQSDVDPAIMSSSLRAFGTEVGQVLREYELMIEVNPKTSVTSTMQIMVDSWLRQQLMTRMQEEHGADAIEKSMRLFAIAEDLGDLADSNYSLKLITDVRNELYAMVSTLADKFDSDSMNAYLSRQPDYSLTGFASAVISESIGTVKKNAIKSANKAIKNYINPPVKKLDIPTVDHQALQTHMNAMALPSRGSNLAKQASPDQKSAIRETAKNIGNYKTDDVHFNKTVCDVAKVGGDIYKVDEHTVSLLNPRDGSGFDTNRIGEWDPDVSPKDRAYRFQSKDYPNLFDGWTKADDDTQLVAIRLKGTSVFQRSDLNPNIGRVREFRISSDQDTSSRK